MYVGGDGVPFVTGLVVFSLLKSLLGFSNPFMSSSVEIDAPERPGEEQWYIWGKYRPPGPVVLDLVLLLV